MTIFLASQAVNDFVYSAVAAAGNDELAPFLIGALRELCGVAGLGGFGEVGVDTGCCKNAAGFVQHGAAALATVAGVGVVNQQCVLDFWGHSQFGPGLVSLFKYRLVRLLRKAAPELPHSKGRAPCSSLP